jgi:tRNA-binding EMAP/Myf-like protein
MKPLISMRDFHRLQLCIGRVTYVETLTSGKKSAYRVRVDLGASSGEHWSILQVTDVYAPAELEGRSVVVLANVELKRVFGSESELLILGVHSDTGAVTLLQPAEPSPAGAEVF